MWEINLAHSSVSSYFFNVKDRMNNIIHQNKTIFQIQVKETMNRYPPKSPNIKDKSTEKKYNINIAHIHHIILLKISILSLFCNHHFSNQYFFKSSKLSISWKSVFFSMILLYFRSRLLKNFCSYFG